MPRVLHLLSQRPSRTGSGITLEALVRHAAAAGWQQRVVAGVPATDPSREVGGLEPSAIDVVTFEGGDLEFAVPGMSDVMPYASTRFCSMTPDMLARYRAAWDRRVARSLSRFSPDVIHSNHAWLLSSSIKQLAPQIPLVIHIHATGLRQMVLCPHLAEEVRRGCARADAFVTLHDGQRDAVVDALEVAPERVHVVGAGYRDDLFHARGRKAASPSRIAYVGKYSPAKGLPELLAAFERIAAQVAGVELHVAGSGTGAEAASLEARMRDLAPSVVLHGALAQAELAALLRTCSVAVLPSYYEGLPLVLVEALACGCRLIATALDGVRTALAPHLGPTLRLVEPPPMIGVDVPDPAHVAAFAERLEDALLESLALPDLGDPASIFPDSLAPFTWGAVFRRVQAVWQSLLP